MCDEEGEKVSESGDSHEGTSVDSSSGREEMAKLPPTIAQIESDLARQKLDLEIEYLKVSTEKAGHELRDLKEPPQGRFKKFSDGLELSAKVLLCVGAVLPFFWFQNSANLAHAQAALAKREAKDALGEKRKALKSAGKAEKLRKAAEAKLDEAEKQRDKALQEEAAATARTARQVSSSDLSVNQRDDLRKEIEVLKGELLAAKAQLSGAGNAAGAKSIEDAIVKSSEVTDPIDASIRVVPAAPAQLKTAEAIIAKLAAGGAKVYKPRNFTSIKPPPKTEVRYFRKQDSELAVKISKRIASLFNIESTPTLLDSTEKPQLVEIWLDASTEVAP